MRDDTFYSGYSIGHDRKYMEEHATLHAHLSRKQRREIAGGIIGAIVIVVAILGLCACVAGIAAGQINVF